MAIWFKRDMHAHSVLSNGSDKKKVKRFNKKIETNRIQNQINSITENKNILKNEMKN